MVVQKNISALNANRQLNIVRKTGSKSVEKLSSGYRINRAADDAAGLSISEKMRKQIRGLAKASENVEDGISLCQVADGAMAEMHDMTNRMNELCVQAANGTNSFKDRSYIQMEIDGIVEEFGRIIDSTKFNEVCIFKEEHNLYSGGKKTYIPGHTIGEYGIASVEGIEGYRSSESLGDTLKFDPNDKLKYCYFTGFGSNPPTYDKLSVDRDRLCAWVDFTNFKANSLNELVSKLNGEGFDSSCCRCFDKFYGIKFVSNCNATDTTTAGVPYEYHYSTHLENNITIKSEVLKIDLENIWDTYKKGTDSLGEVICKTLIDIIGDAGLQAKHPLSNLTTHNSTYAYRKGTGMFYIIDAPDSAPPFNYSKFHLRPRDDSGYVEDVNIKVVDGEVKEEPGFVCMRQLAIHAGADADGINKLIMTLPIMNNKNLKLDEVNVMTENLATDSINVLTQAQQLISANRSRIGAYQNRLEHTALNLDNVIENTTDSESKLRDTDMAEEMVRYSNNNILAQAGQSMLSQANNSQQYILSLLTA